MDNSDQETVVDLIRLNTDDIPLSLKRVDDRICHTVEMREKKRQEMKP